MFVVFCVSVSCHCCTRVVMMPTPLSRVASEVVAVTKLTSWWLRAVIIPTLSSLALKPPRVSSMTKQATGLDAWVSRVKCPAWFVSHLHDICIYLSLYIYIYIWVVYSLCFFCCLFITVTWLYVWCVEWASGNQEEVQACLVTVWLFIISCYSLYKTTLGLFCSWFENNPHFHKYSMDFHV